ncbi:nitrous oxide reductase family maturation protein NosD [Rhizobium sp. ARZ01]|uniref:nitrous oxide reductase family maturation protein NosD n=1 Tax=Rhizobium sp. ARZ01 TaxID=2769313 RepID=UPI00177DCB50|nr:nitrous oxide reductase family maturation protein NosD [Rhizobium sp. ARZ01]MBD9373751.1 nitrous oxide reductase family maturation protein NosD [Rhizobium sp. ARZ01]
MMTRVTIIAMVAFWVAIAIPAEAAERTVTPADNLAAIIEAASPGDRITLRPGKHKGPVKIAKSVTLEGEPGAAIMGDGKGTVVTIDAAGVTLRGLEISGSGTNLEGMDSGVFATENATGALIERNRVTGNLYGIYVHGAADSLLRQNTVIGMKAGRMSELGNGIAVWNAPGAKIVDNDVSFGRDGIFTIASKRNVFSGNKFHDVRFAIHYMYTNNSEISGNTSTGNAVGYALMFSNRLKIIGNVSDGDRDHGLVLNFANGSQIEGNTVIGRMQPQSRWTTAGNRDPADKMPSDDSPVSPDANLSGERLGPEKCIFIYNANKNRLKGNRFDGCSIGIHFTAGSEGNSISGNAFINNRNQVKYVGTRYLDWSVDGRGNYWSDNPAFDLDGDGLGDNAYRPNDVMDKVMWTAPQAKFLATSPAVQVIRWAQAQFPALLPGGVVDSHPLMAPPTQGRSAQ